MLLEFLLQQPFLHLLWVHIICSSADLAHPNLGTGHQGPLELLGANIGTTISTFRVGFSRQTATPLDCHRTKKNRRIHQERDSKRQTQQEPPPLPSHIQDTHTLRKIPGNHNKGAHSLVSIQYHRGQNNLHLKSQNTEIKRRRRTGVRQAGMHRDCWYTGGH